MFGHDKSVLQPCCNYPWVHQTQSKHLKCIPQKVNKCVFESCFPKYCWLQQVLIKRKHCHVTPEVWISPNKTSGDRVTGLTQPHVDVVGWCRCGVQQEVGISSEEVSIQVLGNRLEVHALYTPNLQTRCLPGCSELLVGHHDACNRKNQVEKNGCSSVPIPIKSPTPSVVQS